MLKVNPWRLSLVLLMTLPLASEAAGVPLVRAGRLRLRPILMTALTIVVISR